MEQEPQGRLAIVWHSRTGTARAMARAAAKGAGEAACLMEATDTQPDDLLACDCYLFVCPENLASMSGPMKDLFDRCYYPLLGRIEGRAYATAIAAGSDGSGAEAQLDRIVKGWRLKRVAESLVLCTQAQTPEEILAQKQPLEAELARCHDLGAAMAEGMQMGIF